MQIAHKLTDHEWKHFLGQIKKKKWKSEIIVIWMEVLFWICLMIQDSGNIEFPVAVKWQTTCGSIASLHYLIWHVTNWDLILAECRSICKSHPLIPAVVGWSHAHLHITSSWFLSETRWASRSGALSRFSFLRGRPRWSSAGVKGEGGVGAESLSVLARRGGEGQWEGQGMGWQ